MKEQEKNDVLTINISETPEFIDARKRQLKIVRENPFIEITDTASYEEAKKRRTALVKGRTTIQNGEKAIIKKIGEFRSIVKEKAEDLISITKPHEDKQQEAINPYEDEKKKEKAEKERLKQLQMDQWRVKAQSILNYTDRLINPPDTNAVQLIIDELTVIEINEELYGAYELIAKQNKSKIMDQALTVLDRLIKEEDAEKERLEADLINAREEYYDYFKVDSNEEQTSTELRNLINDDKQARLDKLAELEKAELEKTEKVEVPEPKEEDVVDIEPTPYISETENTDKVAINDWLFYITDAIDSAPEGLKTKKAADIIEKAVIGLRGIVSELKEF